MTARQRYALMALGLVILLGIVAVIVVPPAPPEPKEQAVTQRPEAAAYPIHRRVRYAYTARNTSPDVLQAAALEVYAPVPRTATQKTVQVKASQPYTVIEDETGNRRLRFALDGMAPYASQVIAIEADIALAEQPLPLDHAPSDAYLRAGRFVQSTHPQIKALAARLRATEPMASVHNIYDWVVKNINDAGYLRDDRGALYALEHREGDCTEYMYLVMALARASGIPARGVGGYVVTENAILRPEDYHNWAEIHVGGRWLIVDAQRRKLAEDSDQYVALNLIADDHARPVGDPHRFRVEGEGLKVAMN